MDLGVQILRYYLKVCSKYFIIIILTIVIVLFITLNQKIKIKKEIVSIPKGQNIIEIIDENFHINSLFHKYLYIFYYKFYNLLFNKFIHYGDFVIDEKISYIKFLKIISNPSNLIYKITIVEGWSKNDLNKELSKHFSNYKTISYNDILADTYYYNKGEGFNKFLQKLKTFKKDYFSNINNELLEKYSNDEIIIIGSLIEKEGLDYYDKKKISSVIMNRLEKKMKLQIDATVEFAITKGEYKINRKLTYNDLKIDNPFNTYKINNLPPSPISYVGTKTIDIILENYKSKFLFYFYDNRIKKHIFSIDFDDHKKKLNEYRN